MSQSVGYWPSWFWSDDRSQTKFFGKSSSIDAHKLRVTAASFKTKVTAEERHHTILEAVSHLTRVRALIYFEAIPDPIPVKDFMQFAGIVP
jgi:hypothetical protein